MSDVTLESPNRGPYYGVFDLFKIGIGPSSSHTVGPMRAAGEFLAELSASGLFDQIARVQVDLYGSLALTGHGHATDSAVLMGLQGEQPDQIDPDSIAQKLARIRTAQELRLAGRRPITFREESDLVFNRTVFLEGHPNGIRFQGYSTDVKSPPILSSTYFSVGGGFVVRAEELNSNRTPPVRQLPYFFASARDLLKLAEKHSCSFSDL
ncbi:MAG: L-serine ammonia-lyase, partial [Planctomycetales bacterium 12-60-4]